MDRGDMEMAEQTQPLLPATPAQLDQEDLSEVVIDPKVIGEDGTKETTPVPVGDASPLLLACKEGRAEEAKELLEAKDPALSMEDINMVDEEGALTRAIASEMSDVALALMAQGAKCDVANNRSDTALALTCSQKKLALTQALTGAIATHMLGVMKQLIDRGAVCGPGHTPLYDACRYSFKEGALELLAREKYKKDINTPGYDGKMPLEWAILNNLSAVVVELLKQGANIQKDEKGIKHEDFGAYLDESVTIDKPLEWKTMETWKTKSEEKLVINYSFLSREGEDQTPVLNSVLNLSTEHRELVKHPLVRAFLMMKWRKMVPMWILWISLKLFFFGHLICFAAVIQSSNEQEAKVNETCKTMTNLFKMDTEQTEPMSGQVTFTVAIETCDAMSSPLKLDTDQFDDEGVKHHETSVKIANPLRMDADNYLLMTGQVIFTVLLVIFWLIEAVQMLTSIRAWSREGKNWLQTAILGGSTYLCIAMFLGSGHCETKHVLATLLPMAYYEGLYEVGYHYKAAKYINLFNRVLKTFSKYFVAYVGMIICFAGGYAVMLPAPQDPGSYPDTFWGLLPKVFVMVTGEEEFMNIPFTDHTAFKVWEVLYFLVFLMFTVVVLLNLLNGLAVADAREMLEASETDSLCSLLETAAFWDNKLIKEKKDRQNKSDEKNLEDERKNGEGREEREGKEDCNLTAKLKLARIKLRNWWHEDGGKVLNLVIPLFIKERMKWFFVLKSDSPNYFFSVYEGDYKTYKAYKSRYCENEAGFTINQEQTKMALQIIHTRNLAEEDEKEREREKKERENEKKERENEKRERKKILDTLELMPTTLELMLNQNCRVSEGSN